jgi:hypothetical protein
MPTHEDYPWLRDGWEKRPARREYGEQSELWSMAVGAPVGASAPYVGERSRRRARARHVALRVLLVAAPLALILALR